MLVQEQETSPKILVLGIGNTLRSDDGLGVLLVEMLRVSCANWPELVFLEAGNLNLQLATWLRNTAGLLILDAAHWGTEPGTIQILTREQLLNFAGAKPRSAHEIGLQDILAIGLLTDTLPGKVAILTMQIQTMDWGTDLSPAVSQALPHAVELVQQLLAGWYRDLAWPTNTHIE